VVSIHQPIRLIKRVESAFTKKLPGMRYLSYEERLSMLNLESLEVKRRKNDLVTCFKIVTWFKILKGLKSATLILSFKKILSGGGYARGHSLKLCCPDNSLTNVRVHLFAVHNIIHVWNRLPPRMVAVNNVTSFVRGRDSLSTQFFNVIL